MAMRIEMPQIEASYVTAKQVFDSKLSKNSGAEQLHELHGMSLGSARDFILIYRCMRNGVLFQRTMNAEATRYYLNQIETQSGAIALSQALISVRSHIEYYEALRNTKLQAIRKIVGSFAERTASLPVFDELRFAQEVERSLQDTSEARRARLRIAEPIPKKIEATTEVFVRNPDVVAEVLAQAAGICSVCNRPGPFVRKSNGTRYLEVHHKNRLANGGEDTVENAIALCPNCHREAHYGVQNA